MFFHFWPSFELFGTQMAPTTNKNASIFSKLRKTAKAGYRRKRRARGQYRGARDLEQE